MAERVRAWLSIRVPASGGTTGEPDSNAEGLRGLVLPWLPPVLGPLLLLGPALARGEALFWGTPMLQFTPWRTYAKQLLLDGELPLWNPALGMGAPLLANYQSALLYPPNWILLFLDVAWGQTVLVMLHLMLAGIGMALLARELGLNRFAQAIAGLAFGMSGYLVARAGFLSINAAAAWLPWIALAVERLASSLGREGSSGFGSGGRAKAAAVSVLSIALAMQWLSGHAQLAWYSLTLATAWLLFRALSRAGRAALPRHVAWFAAAGLLALLIAGAQLAPTLEYLSVSDRAAGLDRQFAMTYSFWPWRLTGLIAPDLFGHPRDGSFWGYGNYWEDAIYLGVLPLILAAAALLRRRAASLRWFLAGMGGMAFVLALGQNTPVFPFLFENVPTFALFQAPTRWNVLLVFALALLAGYGADGWGEASGRALYWLRLGTAGAAAMVLAAVLGGRVLDAIQPSFTPAIAQAGGLLVVSGALGLTRRNRPGPIWQVMTIALVLADLLYAARGVNPTLPLAKFAPRPPADTAEYRAQRLYMPSETEQRIKFWRAFRFDDYQADQDWSFVRQIVLPNVGLLDGIASANNFDPILPARYTGWIGRLEAGAPPQQAELLPAMGVGWVADSDGEYQPVAGARRVWIALDATWVDGLEAALEVVFDPSFDPSRQVVLEGSRPSSSGSDPNTTWQKGADGHIVRTSSSAQTSSAAPENPGDDPAPLSREQRAPALATIVGQSANEVEVRVESSRAGWLVLADSWYPGWDAYLDGQPVASYPANGNFRGVWAPEGDHTIVFRYQPDSFNIGLTMSAVGLAGLVLLLLRR